MILTVALALTTLGADALFSQGRQPAGNRRMVWLDGREVVEGEVIVRYRAQSGRIERERAELQAYSDASEAIGRRGARRLRSRDLTTRQMLAALRANPDVEFAEPNFIIRASAMPNDPSMSSLWGLLNTGQTVDGEPGVPGADIGAVAAWDVTTGSRATVIAIIDTGIDFSHPDLAANMFSAPRAFSVTLGSVTVTCPAGSHGFNALNNTCVPFDDNGHGTHVAGIAGAVGNNNVGVTGVNWTANLMALKVLDAAGTGTTADAVKAIDFAIKAKAALGADANVRVLNASWGGSSFSQALNAEIEAANSADMLFVAAAGTDGTNNDVMPHYPASSTSSNVISVAAADNRGALASFSNYGATSVHLAAPGSSTLSTLPNDSYGHLSGTSMSAPHVAGAAALVLSVCPSNTATLKSRLLASVDPEASMSGKTVAGGRLNVGAALQSCVATLHATINGTTITATVENGPGSTHDWLGLYCPASTTDLSYSDWKYLNGSQTPPSAGVTAATVNFAAPTQQGMDCDIRLFANNGMTRLARSGAVVVAPPPTLTLLANGGMLEATLANGPGNARDWIGLFCPATNEDSAYIDFRYLDNTKMPPAGGVTAATVTFAAQASGVSCNARFFVDNGFTKLATSGTVTSANPSANPVPTITTLTPSAVPAGSAASVMVTGTNFVAASVVHVNGAARSTTFGSATQVTVAIPAGDVATAGANPLVTVVNPAPGGGTSNSRTLTVTAGGPTVTPTETTVASAGTVTFSVAGGPGNARDWVALFCPTTGADGDYLDWKYLNNTRMAPASGVTSATVTLTAPAASTMCHARLFADNGFTKLATSATVAVQ